MSIIRIVSQVTAPELELQNRYFTPMYLPLNPQSQVTLIHTTLSRIPWQKQPQELTNLLSSQNVINSHSLIHLGQAHSPNLIQQERVYQTYPLLYLPQLAIYGTSKCYLTQDLITIVFFLQSLALTHSLTQQNPYSTKPNLTQHQLTRNYLPAP